MENSNPRYRIQVDGDIVKIHDTLNTLFKYGYVFGSQTRIKTFSQLSSYFRNRDMEEWSWINTGSDEDCKMVLSAFNAWVWASDLRSYQKISLEDFLVKMGYLNPWDIPPKVGDWPMDVAVVEFRKNQHVQYVLNKSRTQPYLSSDIYSQCSKWYDDIMYNSAA